MPDDGKNLQGLGAGIDKMVHLWYNSNCLDEQITGRFAFQAPSINTIFHCGQSAPYQVDSRPAVRLGNDGESGKGRFAMLEENSGIYCIECIANDKVYIGSSVDISERWRNHIGLLKRNTHHNIYLQRAWNLYGENTFRFLVLEIAEPVDLAKREQWWIDTLDTTSRGEGFNISPMAQSQLGYKHTDETKQKISAYLTGKKIPKDVITKRINTLRAKGIKPTAECLKKAAEHKKINGVSPKAIEAAKIANTGKKQTGEHIEKRVARQRKRYKLTSPLGEEFIVTNLPEFCSQYNLLGCKLCDVCKGRRKHHKGWTAKYA